MSIEIKTDKDIFEIVREHLLKQNDKAISASGDCQYRGFSSNLAARVEEYVTEQCEKNGIEYDYDMFIDELYLYPADAMCALGCLISDNYYDSDLEGTAADTDELIQAIQLSHPGWIITNAGLQMMKHLQRVHDGSTVVSWKDTLNKLSKSFNNDGSYEFVSGGEIIKDFL